MPRILLDTAAAFFFLAALYAAVAQGDGQLGLVLALVALQFLSQACITELTDTCAGLAKRIRKLEVNEGETP